ncbi:ABC transporter substrate-binding protein [Bradyrhizobium sp. CCBAU 51627]|uniref:ABC transporter substrate-binding protein n=1 Tax=Bradyrhizobium sp. CCBAU 51627 TaxID=1325088 RepID=UPI0023054F53|nr:ABC transporter substrate-binding protein [Bradyrhizobium sp. CCBAU 51627]MDA9433610.1 hypothetical protein [Bradyrhizobium sp. CCBAU 51627]
MRNFASELCCASAAAAAIFIVQPAVAQEKPELRITAIISSTGAASPIGIPERMAADLWEKKFSARTDLPYRPKVTIYDDASDPTKSLSIARKAIEEDRAHVVICCTTTPASLAIIDTVTAAKVTNISMGAATSVASPASSRPFTYKTPISDNLLFQQMLGYMKSHGIKLVGFFGAEDSYGENGLKELQNVAKADGLEVVATERFSRQDTNFTPQALRLKQTKLDAIVVYSTPPSANLAHEALRRVGYQGPLYHGGGSANNAFLELGKSSIENAVVAVGGLNVYDQISKDNPMRKSLEEFAAIYDGAYGKGKVDLFGGQAWDAMNLAATAFQDALKTRVQKDDLPAMRIAVNDAMQRIKEFPGVDGVFNFTSTDHLGLDGRSNFLAQVRGGRFILLREGTAKH